MSLLSAMKKTSNVAIESYVDDELLFGDEIAMEASELIDTMIDKKHPFGDDIDEMQREDEMEDEINEELEREDNNIPASEAAALTGNAFFKSINLNDDDPIKTSNGSIGDQNGTANHKDNYSAEADDNNDPITTKNGSIGDQNSTANHKDNYSAEADDKDDPIKTSNGSIGQKNSSANPVVESALFFGELMGKEEVMESLIADYTFREKHSRAGKLNTLGIQNDLAIEQVQALCDNGDFDGAMNMVVEFGSVLESAKELAFAEDEQYAAESLLRTNGALLLKISEEKQIAAFEAKGMSREDAQNAAIAALESKVYDTNDDMLISCMSMVMEHAKFLGNDLDDDDPIITKNGSIGQKDSAATNPENYSGGSKDDNDPIKTENGGAGQKTSSANPEDNFSGEYDDNNDPIKTENGSIGQKDSSANPVVESELSIDDELAKITAMFDDLM